MNGQSSGSGKVWPVILIILILVAVALYVAYAKGWISIGGQKIDEQSIIYQEQEGSVADNFPKELLIEEGVAVSDSYSISYLNENVDLPVASYFSAKSLEENISMFDTYLKANQWVVLQSADVKSPVPFFYATRGGEDLNITFQNKNGKVYVVIAYSVQK